MKFGKLVLLMVVSVYFLTLTGCGSGADSETNGNIILAVTATTGNPYQVDATATFSKAVPNFPITFDYKIISTNEPTGVFGSSGAISTNDLGVATYTLNVFPTNVEMLVQIEAKSGNVSSGAKGVVIPALVPN